MSSLQGLKISLHTKAPMFQKEKNPNLVLSQIMTELSSKNASTAERRMKLYREAGFVSLFFFPSITKTVLFRIVLLKLVYIDVSDLWGAEFIFIVLN